MEDTRNDSDNVSESIHDKTATTIPLSPIRTPKATSTFDLSYSDVTSRDDELRDGNMYVIVVLIL